MNIFGNGSPWHQSPFSGRTPAHRYSMGQEGPIGFPSYHDWWHALGKEAGFPYEPNLKEKEELRANGGMLKRRIGFLWFFPDPDVMDKIEAATGKRPSESIEARVTSCIPLPPIAPTFGAFLDPETGYYCDIDLPKDWRCVIDAPWACDENQAVEPSQEGLEYVPYDPVGTAPYFGEWGVVGGECGKVGPFDTIDEAFGAAAEAASEHGATALPGDGWAQVKDSEGKGVGPIT